MLQEAAMTDPMQLDIYGGQQPTSQITKNQHPLSQTQKNVLTHLRTHHLITSTQAGIIAHKERGHCAYQGARVDTYTGKGQGCCGYASTDGLEILKSLARRGLVQRIAETLGRWELTDGACDES